MADELPLKYISGKLETAVIVPVAVQRYQPLPAEVMVAVIPEDVAITVPLARLNAAARVPRLLKSNVAYEYVPAFRYAEIVYAAAV
jgi:hypothetical protein